MTMCNVKWVAVSVEPTEMITKLASSMQLFSLFWVAVLVLIAHLYCSMTH